MNDSYEKPSRFKKIEINIECTDRLDFVYKLDKFLRKHRRFRGGFYSVHIEKVELPI